MQRGDLLAEVVAERRPRIGPVTAVDVRIYEVGPRDGLQAEPTIVATEDKLRFIALLADAGLREIEATSLVSPKAIPQLADADELMSAPRPASRRALPGAGAEPARPGARRWPRAWTPSA